MIPGLCIVDTHGKHELINTGKRITKLNITRILRTTFNDDDKESTKLLMSPNNFTTVGSPEVMITDVLRSDDPRGWLSKLELAKAEKVYGLLKRGVFEIVMTEYISEGVNILEGHFVLAIKNDGTKKMVCRASFVVQRNIYAEKNIRTHASPNSCQKTVRLLIAAAATFGYIL